MSKFVIFWQILSHDTRAFFLSFLSELNVEREEALGTRLLNNCWMKVCSGTNFIQHDFCLSFQNFTNFVIAQTSPTFHPTWKKCNVGWNVGLVCSGLNPSTSETAKTSAIRPDFCKFLSVNRTFLHFCRV